MSVADGQRRLPAPILRKATARMDAPIWPATSGNGRTRSSNPYPYRAEAGWEEEKGAVRVMRGGAFPFNRGRARCAFRGRHLPVFLWLHYGFRVAAALPRQAAENWYEDFVVVLPE
jgi:formylglycine-generating enzyme required for sulfatase activity